MPNDIDGFVAEYVKELQAGTAAVFVGAGLSAAAGFVDWVGLLQPLAANLGLDASKESDNLVALAQYHVNENGQNRSGLARRLLEEFPVSAEPHQNHRLLARLPISVYWTTNYDRLIERALEAAGKIVDAKYSVDQLAFTKPRRDAVVFKMHGDIEHPNEAVLTKDDYERYPFDRGAFVNALTGDLVSATFLFLGFSFKDPNLDYVLSRIRIRFERNARQHYCILKRVALEADEPTASFEYKQIKQRLVLEDLKRFNIKTLLVDDYAQITDVLQRIERIYRRKTLFVSGSAVEFGDWKREDVSEFLYDLGKIVIQHGYRLVSGFGWGISNELLSGAIEQIYAQHPGHVQDHLVVRPFPRYVADAHRRDALWTSFREDLISQAGVALFLFGNKEVDGITVSADGTHREYQIAQAMDLVTVPIGATGYVAEELGQLQTPVVLAGSSSETFKEVFQDLQASAAKPQELLSRIAKLLDVLSHE